MKELGSFSSPMSIAGLALPPSPTQHSICWYPFILSQSGVRWCKSEVSHPGKYNINELSWGPNLNLKIQCPIQ